jgi:TolB-like protein
VVKARAAITCKLVRVRDQIQMWASSFDSEPSDLLAFQRKRAAIAQQVHLRLSPQRLQA